MFIFSKNFCYILSLTFVGLHYIFSIAFRHFFCLPRYFAGDKDGF